MNESDPSRKGTEYLNHRLECCVGLGPDEEGGAVDSRHQSSKCCTVHQWSAGGPWPKHPFNQPPTSSRPGVSSSASRRYPYSELVSGAVISGGCADAWGVDSSKSLPECPTSSTVTAAPSIRLSALVFRALPTGRSQSAPVPTHTPHTYGVRPQSLSNAASTHFLPCPPSPLLLITAHPLPSPTHPPPTPSIILRFHHPLFLTFFSSSPLSSFLYNDH